MRQKPPKSIDDYECQLSETVAAWSPTQRVALAAALVERWLPTYEAFAMQEQWGDPDCLRQGLEAVWNQVRGQPPSVADLARHRAQLRDCTPHMDDFEAPAALAVCMILQDALACCTGDNETAVVRAALSAFEAAVPDWVFEPDEQPRLWKQVAARKELRKQLRVVDQIGGMTRFDEPAIARLRQELTSPELVGETSPPSRDAGCSTALTNQEAFEQYRRMVESDLRSPAPVDLPGVPFALLCVGVWSGRYSRRRQTIDGSYGRLADPFAQQALMARQRAHDAAVTERPAWDADARQIIELSFAHAHGMYDVRSPYEPHGYGPSLRRLWVEARRAGQSDREAWESVVAWARHRPVAWQIEDQRRRKGQAYTSPALAAPLARALVWDSTGDADYPWAAQVEGSLWRVRVNDFPDDFLYTLLVDNTEVGHVHDWPRNWHRG